VASALSSDASVDILVLVGPEVVRLVGRWAVERSMRR
jgi:hypothetical protein